MKLSLHKTKHLNIYFQKKLFVLYKFYSNMNLKIIIPMYSIKTFFKNKNLRKFVKLLFFTATKDQFILKQLCVDY